MKWRSFQLNTSARCVDMNGDAIFNLFYQKKIVIAGPCAVESKKQIMTIARALKELNVDFLRGGCFKARTSPDSFQGLGFLALDYLLEAKAETGLPIVVEITSENQLERYINDVDVIQVGSRNMQNFELLKALSGTDKPILLKRGFSATYQEWLNASRYITMYNHRVILCERGIRSFETETRNVLDLQAVPVMQSKTKLPIIVDPSHAAGRADIIPTMCKGAFAVGANGIMVEVHNEPEKALCDKNQALNLKQFEAIMGAIQNV